MRRKIGSSIIKAMKKELIKKAKLPFKKMSANEKDYVAVVLEEVRDNFKVFGESLDFARKKGEATFEEVGRIRVEIEEIKDTQVLMQSDITVLKQDVKQINVRLGNIENEISAIRSEINSLKIILTQKADVDFLKTLEIRLVRVEQRLKSSNL